VRLRTAESTLNGAMEIELVCATVVLPDASAGALTFLIALAADSPQALATSLSALTHTLSASVAGVPALKCATAVFPVWHSPAQLVLPPAPQTVHSDVPTAVSAEVLCMAFFAGERVPVYVRVLPPAGALVVAEGLCLRNMRVKIVRTIRVLGPADDKAPNRKPNPVPGSSGEKAPKLEEEEDAATEDEDGPAVHRTVVTQ
jgi:hypothetical protein